MVLFDGIVMVVSSICETDGVGRTEKCSRVLISTFNRKGTIGGNPDCTVKCTRMAFVRFFKVGGPSNGFRNCRTGFAIGPYHSVDRRDASEGIQLCGTPT